MSPALRVALVTTAVLLAGPARAGEVEATPSLPAGVAPLPEAMRGKLARLVEETARLRGLDPRRQAPVGLVDEAGARRLLVEAFERDMPAGKLAALERALKLAGLLPRDVDLRERYLRLLASQVAGFYDPRQGYLAVVDRPQALRGPEAERLFGAELAARLEEAVLVHEIAHALQDQHFPLADLVGEGTASDPSLAALALVEGDATHVMYSYLLGVAFERLPLGEEVVSGLARDPERLAAVTPDLPGTRELFDAPAYLRETLLFPYLDGLVFCTRVRGAGGQKLLDRAFRHDPPVSTEQVLHPEKWIALRDEPVRIELPDLGRRLKGYRKRLEGSWGELGTRLVLSERLGAGGRERAEAAAAGWGGDAWALYEKDARDAVFAWVTEWDDAGEAREFAALAREAFAPPWRLATREPARVVLLLGAGGRKARGVEQALLAAPSRATPPRPIDLAALGITEEDRPRLLDLPGLLEWLNDPVLLRMTAAGLGIEGGEVDLKGLFADPRFRERIAQQIGGLDLREALEQPALRALVEQLLESSRQAPRGRVAGDVFAIDELGFSVRAPGGGGWRWTEPSAGEGPAPAALLVGPPPCPQVGVVILRLPMAFPLEGLVLGMEAVAPLEDYEALRSGYVTSGEGRAYEKEYRGRSGGVPVRARQRVHVVGNTVVTVAAMGEAESWEGCRPALDEVFAGIALLPHSTR